MQLRLLPFAGLLALCCACPAGSSDAANSGVPSNKQLQALSPAENLQLCRWSVQLRHASTQAECTRASIDDTTSPADCSTRTKQCEQILGSASAAHDAGTDTDAGSNTDDCRKPNDYGGCTATVSQAEPCMRASADAYNRPDCATSGKPLVLPAVCAQLFQKCPRLQGTSNSGGPSGVAGSSGSSG